MVKGVFLKEQPRLEPVSCINSLCKQCVLMKFSKEGKLEAFLPQRISDHWGINMGCNLVEPKRQVMHLMSISTVSQDLIIWK